LEPLFEYPTGHKSRHRLLSVMSRSGPALRSEADGFWYFEEHPEVAEYFKQVGVFSYCERLTTFHQQVAEDFALSFDGRIAKVGREEFMIDEASISEYIGLSRTGTCWFKTSLHSNVEFRSYLLPVHKSLTWKKDIPLSYLEPKWQTLLKAILVYITCEGRYNRVLYYHFKLLNHFTGREPLNMPYFFYKTLVKMEKQVQAHPTKVSSRISHQGLICLLIKEGLHRKQIGWNHFLFWNEFNTEKPPESKTKRSRNRNPPVNHRRRKGISMPRQAIQAAPSTRGKIKKNLKQEDRKFVTGKNPLNLPYSDSGSEEQEEKTQNSLHAKQEVKFEVKASSSKLPEKHSSPKAETSSRKPHTGKTKKINKLLREIYEMEVLERVIKKANSDLTERVAELTKENEAIKERHDSIKVRNRELIRENMKLYRQLRELRLKLKKFETSGEEQTGLDALANLATTIIEVTDSPARPAQVRKSARIKATAAKKT
jgi:hypothetical protein